ncbi:MAG TPA: Spy/CpxP family protein refolding chaperone [Gemmatimonadaceae bacterium]
MRSKVLLLLSAVAVAACSNDSTAPDPDLDASTIDIGAFGTALTTEGAYDADLYQLRLANGLPDSLKLTDAQKAQIKALVDAYLAATKADREALIAIIREATEAIRAKKPREEIRAIIERAAPIRARLAAAEAALKAAIDAVLTPEQRAWLASHRPQRCDPSKFPPLTDAQKAQIRSLENAFVENNRADLEAVKNAVEQARAAKTREEALTILNSVRPAIERLELARRQLRAAIENVLTPEQKASGCVPLG